jgi:hypothetical protein
MLIVLVRVRLYWSEYRVTDKCATVISFVNANTCKANSSQQMDYKVRSHDLGNPPCSYYYVKKVLQVVRLVKILELQKGYLQYLKNKVHIILMQQYAWYKTWYMHGVSYTILMLQNSCSVGYLLPSLETFHSTTTKKFIHLFTDVAIHEVAW